MVCAAMTYTIRAHIAMACTGMAHTGMAYIVMAYVDVVCIPIADAAYLWPV